MLGGGITSACMALNTASTIVLVPGADASASSYCFSDERAIVSPPL